MVIKFVFWLVKWKEEVKEDIKVDFLWKCKFVYNRNWYLKIEKLIDERVLMVSDFLGK